MKIKFGDESAQEDFQNRFKSFIEEIVNIKTIIESCEIIRKNDYKQELVYFLWHSIWDDFSEILLLYANGYPLGALKILRGMFERTVHICHFLEHPENIDLFLDFAWIDEKKMINLTPELYAEEYKKNVSDEVERVKSQFQVPVCDVCKVNDCEKCKKTRTSHAWFGKSNIVDMALELNMLKVLIKGAYYIPLQETHPKLQSLDKRIFTNDKGILEYRHDSESHKSDLPLYSAHLFLIASFEAFMKFSEFPETEKITEELHKGYEKAWDKVEVNFEE